MDRRGRFGRPAIALAPLLPAAPAVGEGSAGKPGQLEPDQFSRIIALAFLVLCRAWREREGKALGQLAQEHRQQSRVVGHRLGHAGAEAESITPHPPSQHLVLARMGVPYQRGGLVYDLVAGEHDAQQRLDVLTGKGGSGGAERDVESPHATEWVAAEGHRASAAKGTRCKGEKRLVSGRIVEAVEAGLKAPLQPPESLEPALGWGFYRAGQRWAGDGVDPVAELEAGN